jgi:enoyl-CoA hydratase
MDLRVVRYQVDRGVGLVTLDRPERMNAWTVRMEREYAWVLRRAESDPAARVVVVTGAGRGFCVGADFKALDVMSDTGSYDVAGERPADEAGVADEHAPTLAMRLSKPVIAAVNGPATGGGLALALACDVRVASDSARFNVAFIRVGLSGCDIGVSYLLPRLVGASRAFELMLTGRMVEAAEADRIGLVSRVVPDGQVVDTALETAELIRANSPFGVWMTKEVMWSNLEAGSLQGAIDLENRTQLLSSHTGDMREALAAFLEKRPPNFSGR